jgi:hypothetical protein
MNIIGKATLISSALFVGACSTTTTPTLLTVPGIGAANVEGAVYSVTTAGVTDTVIGPATRSGNFISWLGAGGSNTRGGGYESADVLAIGAMYKADPHDTFAGITGTLSPVQTAGTASYNTNFAAVTVEPSGAATFAKVYTSIVTIDVDFGAGTLTGAHAPWQLDINGTIVGSQFSGTAAFQGNVNTTATTVPMLGGFYGTDTIAGVFAGDGLAGAFGGTMNP